jgi:hypothetical protein
MGHSVGLTLYTELKYVAFICHIRQLQLVYNHEKCRILKTRIQNTAGSSFKTCAPSCVRATVPMRRPWRLYEPLPTTGIKNRCQCNKTLYQNNFTYMATAGPIAIHWTVKIHTFFRRLRGTRHKHVHYILVPSSCQNNCTIHFSIAYNACTSLI